MTKVGAVIEQLSVFVRVIDTFLELIDDLPINFNRY